VLAVPGFGSKDRKGFFAGLANWVDGVPPTYDAIAGAGVVKQAATRYEAISKTGGVVLGMRPLQLDGILTAIPAAA
jgi:hypothetical protein